MERRPLPAPQRIADFVSLSRIELATFQLIKGDPLTDDGSAWHWAGLFVIVSAAIEQDGNRWLHVSMSRQGQLPTYDDLTLVKYVFVGDERTAIQIFPAKEEHVNIHPHCLHLWSCIDARPLPDFRYVDRTGRKGI